MHRIFVAVNLPEGIKKELVGYQKNWPTLPIRWIKKENLHITLMFLGSISEEEIPEVLGTIEQVAQKYNPLSVNLIRICYAPPNKMPPRMLWAVGEKSEKLGQLYNDLQNSLLASSLKGSIGSENRPYSPHITLGRIRQWEFKRVNPEERPDVREKISLNFMVNSIEVMESRLKPTGAEYTVLKSYKLK